MGDTPTVPITALPFALDTGAHEALYLQLYRQVRTAILAGQIAPGTRLPATRALAASLGVSRNTIISAFEQLLAEGYLQGRVGDGTYVSRALPEDTLLVKTEQPRQPETAPRQRRLSQRGTTLAATPVTVTRTDGAPAAFRPGLPALDSFPDAVWGRLLNSRWRSRTSSLLGYGQPAGYEPLREAIASYLRAARGVRCEAAQVLVVAGSQQALDLVARVLLDPGDAVLIENPGYLGARGALGAAGARLVPVPVDGHGLDVAAGAALGPARMAVVTPSHQFPLGVTMSLARRLALLEWAEQNDAWVLEDDYDSEYRYAGRPLAALQGLDTSGRVLYTGTFSKVLFPGLRLGYLVAPPDLVSAFVAARALIDRQSPTLDQAVLADFISEGHFARHIRRMRALYAQRQELLVGLARRNLCGLLEVEPAEAGMHLVGWLPQGNDDQIVSRNAAKAGIDVPPLSAYSTGLPVRSGVLLGYTALDEPTMRAGVAALRRSLLGV